MTHEQIEIDDIATLLTPIILIQGLARGEIEPERCEIIDRSDNTVTYRVHGFEGDMILTDEFLSFLKDLGKDEGLKGLFKTLHRLGCMDDLTLEIFERRMVPEPIRSIVKINIRDKEKLEKISRIEEHVPYRLWGKYLDMTKQGAFYVLKRLKDKGLLVLDKNEHGVKAELTQLGKEALGLL
ncbi:MAG: hypothetical protein L6M37_00110 [Candidatus Methylarchaceae archaeon HK02M1]|nr:hypothetical protein [Candidatus Methylarchaceae archaeon HK02M1]